MSLINLFKKNLILSVFILALTLVLIAIELPKIKQAASSGQISSDGPTVTLLKISDYQKTAAITLDSGSVESVNQADLRSQFSAPVESVNVALGDKVVTGQVLVSLKKTDIAAQLDQAKAGLANALASLQSVEKGARSEDIAISRTQADQATLSLQAALRDSYAKADDAIRNHVDKFFLGADTQSPEFKIVINSANTSIQYGAVGSEQARLVAIKRVELEKRLNDWKADLEAIDGSSDLSSGVKTAAANLDFLIGFLNDLSPLANTLTTDNSADKQTLDGYKAELSAARSSAAGSLSSLQGAETSWILATQALNLKTAGATNEQLLQAKAMVAQAAAAVAVLEAQVEKTIIRAPIEGRISYLDALTGEVISNGQLVASIVNPDALQIKTYASIADLPNITQNDLVKIGDGGNIVGTVYRISPAIDPNTKKAEILVIVTKNNPDSPIVIGQTVNLSIESKKSNTAQPVYLLPIQAVKTNGVSDVFAVSSNGLVFAIPVAAGDLVGEKIEVSGSLDPNQKIISSTIGIAPGDKVIISEQ